MSKFSLDVLKRHVYLFTIQEKKDSDVVLGSASGRRAGGEKAGGTTWIQMGNRHGMMKSPR
ncbi:hypothetical protein [Acetomicrobium sp.]|uniref:hypothetical protein n=1 Tax=Acetomicrobium sp. TaxID=1872099 RepID=UPI0028714C53|nr:hypothetical protein [Acetomicrobium sp.]MDR9770075.1 hypothetical protein [Acetomicrobium sp.]